MNGESDRRDLTILGRKISAFYLKKQNKISVLQKLTGSLNISTLTLVHKDEHWLLVSENDLSSNIMVKQNIIDIIAFMVWNNIFSEKTIHLRPNPTDITLKEIQNIGASIKSLMGSYDSLDIDYSNFLKTDSITKMLIIAGMEQSPWYHPVLDIGIVYLNCWGELFVSRFDSADQFEDFIQKTLKTADNVETGFYMRRNSTAYEKIITRTKQILRLKIKI